ncbi:MAG: sulfite exporter TauE/SafE family protein [Thermoleophilia bacterium]|nr:sulfite exporter TauE/SafE family protein [Thermoleophilia bacterium]
MPRLLLIGLVAGFFAALFGVGGGILIVPLLVLVASFAERRAMATSLAAIGITAAAGAVVYALHGYLHPVDAAVVGVPAMAGAVVGATLQQRVANRTLALLFAALLAAIGVMLIAA